MDTYGSCVEPSCASVLSGGHASSPGFSPFCSDYSGPVFSLSRVACERRPGKGAPRAKPFRRCTPLAPPLGGFWSTSMLRFGRNALFNRNGDSDGRPYSRARSELRDVARDIPLPQARPLEWPRGETVGLVQGKRTTRIYRQEASTASRKPVRGGNTYLLQRSARPVTPTSLLSTTGAHVLKS
jgi:hypothetical protein